MESLRADRQAANDRLKADVDLDLEIAKAELQQHQVAALELLKVSLGVYAHARANEFRVLKEIVEAIQKVRDSASAFFSAGEHQLHYCMSARAVVAEMSTLCAAVSDVYVRSQLYMSDPTRRVAHNAKTVCLELVPILQRAALESTVTITDPAAHDFTMRVSQLANLQADLRAMARAGIDEIAASLETQIERRR